MALFLLILALTFKHILLSPVVSGECLALYEYRNCCPTRTTIYVLPREGWAIGCQSLDTSWDVSGRATSFPELRSAIQLSDKPCAPLKNFSMSSSLLSYNVRPAAYSTRQTFTSCRSLHIFLVPWQFLLVSFTRNKNFSTQNVAPDYLHLVTLCNV